MVHRHHEHDPHFDSDLRDFCPLAEMPASEGNPTVLVGVTKDGCFQQYFDGFFDHIESC